MPRSGPRNGKKTKTKKNNKKKKIESYQKNVQKAIMNTFETNEKIQSLSKEIENLNQGMEDTEKNQMEILKLKKIIKFNKQNQ